MSYNDQLRRIVDQYVKAGQEWPTPAKTIAGWAIRQGLWNAQPWDLIDQCADQLARAMREEYYVDPQGRSVRTKHAVRKHGGQKNLTLWGDIRTAPREYMHTAFQQRRQQVVGDCRQLKVDVDSYNENQSVGEPIQMIFDFTNDLAELEAGRLLRFVPPTR
jgi:hypothetical protein